MTNKAAKPPWAMTAKGSPRASAFMGGLQTVWLMSCEGHSLKWFGFFFSPFFLKR